MDELELLEMFCKDAKINKDEPIYILRGEGLLRGILRGEKIANPNKLKTIYEKAKVNLSMVMLDAEVEVFETVYDRAIEMAKEELSEQLNNRCG